MDTVTVSSKYQIVIPKNIRRNLSISAGQKFQVIQYGDRIELIPMRKPAEMRGFLSGIKTDVRRDDDRV